MVVAFLLDTAVRWWAGTWKFKGQEYRSSKYFTACETEVGMPLLEKERVEAYHLLSKNSCQQKFKSHLLHQ